MIAKAERAEYQREHQREHDQHHEDNLARLQPLPLTRNDGRGPNTHKFSSRPRRFPPP